MRLICLTLLFQFLITTAWAINDREASSFFISKRAQRKIEKLDPSLVAQATSIYQTIEAEGNICADTIVKKLKSELELNNKTLSTLLLGLRQENLFDDIYLKSFQDYQRLSKTIVFKRRLNLRKLDSNLNQQIKRVFTSYLRAPQCENDRYRDLYRKLQNLEQQKEFKRWSYFAFKEKILTEKQYLQVRKHYKRKSHEVRKTLSDYQKQRAFLRDQRSDFPGSLSTITAQKIKRQKSLRMSLYEKYSSFQILLMSELVKKLQARLGSQKVEIHVFEEREDLDPLEIITLSPMERYRFAAKMLQQEMNNLIYSSHFNGQAVSYQEIIMAGYETGLIPGKEVDIILAVEEIWSPKRTFFDKARTWINFVGGVAALFVPPPYSFVPVLGMMVIEMTTTKEKPNNENSLF